MAGDSGDGEIWEDFRYILENFVSVMDCIYASVNACVHVHWYVRCTSFLLMCNNIVTNLEVPNSIYIYYPSFCGLGFWALLHWDMCFNVSSESFSQSACWGCSLISRLKWGRIHFWVHTIVGGTQFLVAYWTEVSLVAQMVKCLPAMWETWVQSLCWKGPLGKEMATHSSTLACEIPWTEGPGGL